MKKKYCPHEMERFPIEEFFTDSKTGVLIHNTPGDPHPVYAVMQPPLPQYINGLQEQQQEAESNEAQRLGEKQQQEG